MEQKIITQEGKDKMETDLKELKEVKLPDIIDKIEKAKELGDLSENAEYHDAKDQQGFINARILEIEATLKNAIMSVASTSKDEISIGSTFVVESEEGVKKEFTLVGFSEADPIIGKISNESPMGEAFLSHKVGDVVEIKIPKGLVSYTISEIK